MSTSRINAAKFAREGHKVHVIIATDGKDGTRVTKIPAGDLLGNLRKKESECACKKLGIQPPYFCLLTGLTPSMAFAHTSMDARCCSLHSKKVWPLSMPTSLE